MNRKTPIAIGLLHAFFLLFSGIKVVAQEAFIRHTNQSIWTNGVKNFTILGDSSYVLFSNNRVNSYSRLNLSKWSKNDTLIWSKDFTFGNSDFTPGQMIPSINGGYILAGGQGDLIIMRTDSAGNALWTRNIDNGNNEYADGVAELANGDLFISGHGQDAFLCKLDSTGNIIWNKKFHLEKNTTDCRLVKLNTGSICLAGTVEYNMSYSYDIFLTCVDTAGNIIWHEVLNAKANEFISSCMVDANGDILITGRTIKQPNGRYFPFISKVSSVGTVLFFHEYSDPTASVSFNAIVSTSANDYFVAGDVQDSIAGMNNFQDPVLIHVNATGEVIWGTRFLLPFRETALSILQLPGKHLLLGGSSDNAGLTDILEIKVKQNGITSCSQAAYTLHERVVDVETDSPPVSDSTFFSGNTLNIQQSANTPVITVNCSDTSHVSAYFSSLANIVCAGSTLTFTNQSTNAFSYRWYLNGILADTSINFNHTFSSSGTDTIRLTASSATDSSFYYMYIQVDLQPVAGFTDSRSLLRNSFTNTSIAATSFHWDFGDGFTAREENPFHNYLSTGNYTVCLAASNSCGSDVACQTLYLSDTIMRRFTHLYSDHFYHVIEDNDGGYICVGELGFNAQVGLTKTDKVGNVIWSRPLPMQTNVTTVKSIVTCSNNGYAFLTQEYNTHHSAIVRTDSAGNILWRKEFYTASNTQGLYKMCPTIDGGFAIAGLGGNPAPVLMKLNRYGESEWCYKYQGGANAFSIAVTSTNHFLICGRSATGNIYVIKTNALGQVVWAKEYVDANGDSQGYAVMESADGNYLIAANGKSPINVPLGTDLLLFKTDNTGSIIWNKYFDISYFENPGAMLEDSRQNIFISKEFNTDFADILKLDAGGNLLKGNYYYTSLPSETHYAGLSLTRDDGIITCGIEEDYPCTSCNGGLLMKLDSTLDAPCNSVLSAITTGNRPLTINSVNEIAQNEPAVTTGIYSNLFYSIASDTIACYHEVVYPVAVQDIQTTAISISPNPAFPSSVISFTGIKEKSITITLTNIYGISISVFNKLAGTNVPLSIQLPALHPGMYFITISGKKSTFTKKLIVRD
ncbi:MAG: PKD domain-containing protein [Bacteroidetes bacterium]|nr:PKD domain-containing protein [Bacteroidota bacterium]